MYWLFIAPLALSDLRKRPQTVSGHLSMALLALAALLGVQAEDTVCLLQSHKAQALRTVTCPHGFETYDFSQLASEALQYWHGTSRRWHLDYKF